MAGVSHIIINDDQVQRVVERAVAFGVDPSRLMNAISGYMVTSVQRRFETETGPDGKRWQRLSPRYANSRIKGTKRIRGYDNKLKVKGDLLRSIIDEVSDTSASVGSNDKRARIHQLGGTINKPARRAKLRLRATKAGSRFAGKRHKRVREMDVSIGAHKIVIPARPYLGFSQEDIAEITLIGENAMRDMIEGAR